MTLFCYNATTTTVIYTLSLHDALPISDVGQHAAYRVPGRPAAAGPAGPGRRQGHRAARVERAACRPHAAHPVRPRPGRAAVRDRKSTRLNSSHMSISYAVFCLKKKNKV